MYVTSVVDIHSIDTEALTRILVGWLVSSVSVSMGIGSVGVGLGAANYEDGQPWGWAAAGPSVVHLWSVAAAARSGQTMTPRSGQVVTAYLTFVIGAGCLGGAIDRHDESFVSGVAAALTYIVMAHFVCAIAVALLNTHLGANGPLRLSVKLEQRPSEPETIDPTWPKSLMDATNLDVPS